MSLGLVPSTKILLYVITANQFFSFGRRKGVDKQLLQQS
jgi:hypothetical protein